MILQSHLCVASLAGVAFISETTTTPHPDPIDSNGEQKRTINDHATGRAAASMSLIQQQQLVT